MKGWCAMLKEVFIKNLLKIDVGKNDKVEINGWVKKKRKNGKIIFFDIIDSTGEIQVVINRDNFEKDLFEKIKKISIESAVKILGILKDDCGNREIEASEFYFIGENARDFSPPIRGNFDIFDNSFTDHVLSYRHLYIRNPQIMAILRFRDKLKRSARNWFEKNDYTEIDAPILTPVPLYHDDSAMGITVYKEDVFLTQCVGYYLESAAHAFEKVYNIGPSFRGEESNSKRHLMEYWHIKAELLFGNREDIINIVESFIKHIVEECGDDIGRACKVLKRKGHFDGLNIPYERITYREAINYLKKKGVNINFGKGLGSSEEEILSKDINGPFWIVGIPEVVEPFPYIIDPSDKDITLVADLIASDGYGELLGVAEKISNIAELDLRMKNKGKFGNANYDWIREVHQMGCVPHIAFGMGVERLIRWLLNIPHVRDAIPFPRIFKRKIYP